MSWITQIFSSGVEKVVSSAGEAIDRLITSDEERLTLRNELVLIQARVKLEGEKQALDAEANLEREISDRWKSDNATDSSLAKNVRPAALIYLMMFMSVIIIADSTAYFIFDVKDAYVTLLETLLVVTFAAYFGSRGFEKVMKK